MNDAWVYVISVFIVCSPYIIMLIVKIREKLSDLFTAKKQLAEQIRKNYRLEDDYKEQIENLKRDYREKEHTFKEQERTSGWQQSKLDTLIKDYENLLAYTQDVELKLLSLQDRAKELEWKENLYNSTREEIKKQVEHELHNQYWRNEYRIKCLKDAERKAHDRIEAERNALRSNLTFIPYASKIVSDVMTSDFKDYEEALDWGHSVARQNKIKSIRDIRHDAKERIESLKWAEYQLAYLLNLYPTLQEVIETEFKELEITYEEVKDYDRVRDYLSTEEWKNLSTTEKNQLALDRYVESRKKSKWQIGRDYELFVGYDYSKKGYSVDYFGSYMGLEDLGRDLIIKKGKTTYIVQCKYWSKEKQIHENHIMQLYGSVISYGIENPDEKAQGILVTNISLSNTAKKFADTLKIKYIEHKDIGMYPRIKCNIGKDEKGNAIKIYHLPMDMQYDKVKIDKPGELLALTVDEAEKAGFRRAYKWHGEKSE